MAVTCSRCDSMARQLAEARDELAAYKAYAREIPKPLTDDYAAFRRVFGVAGAPTRLLEALMAKPGALVSVEAAGRIASGLRETTGNVARVQICRLRAALRPHGISVRTMWGAGYWIDPEDAAKVRELTA